MRDDLDNLGGPFSPLLPIQPNFHCSNNLLPFTHLWSLALLVIQTITKPDSMLRSTDITLPTKVNIVKLMVFPAVTNRCESWTIRKAESWRIDAFELWCWKRLLESPLDCKKIKPVNSKGNQPWIFIETTDAEAPILLPPDVTHWRGSDAGKDWRQKEEGEAEDELNSITDSMDMNVSKLLETVEDRGAWCAAVPGNAKSWTRFSNWTTIRQSC